MNNPKLNSTLPTQRIKGSINENAILESILSKVVKINWQKYLNKEPDKNLLKSEMIVAVVDYLLDLAQKEKFSLCQHNGSAFLFNGAFWVKLEDHALSNYLGYGARKMGIDKPLSHYYSFRDSLMKQYKSAAPQMSKKASNAILVNLSNGTLQVSPQGYVMKDFDPHDFLTYQLPFEYDKDAEAKTFEIFLNKVLPDQTVQNVLAEYIGYLFIPNSVMKLEKVLMLIGEGANGKSTFYDIINGLLGRENVTTYSISKLTDSNGYYRAMIGNKLLNYSSEIGNRMDATVFKQLASGEAVEARLPYREPMILENYARLIFNTNGLPTDVEHNHAFFRRFLIIPFNVTIPEHEQDKHLSQRITQNELPGVLNWVLKGLERLIKQKGFSESEIIDNALVTYKKESDNVLMFIEDQGYVYDSANRKALKEVYFDYKVYCADNGYRPLGNKNFRKRIEKQGFTCQKTNVGIVVNCKKTA